MSQMAPQHILKLSTLEQRAFIDSFDLVLSDCDGVIWMVVEPIPDTGKAINLLKRAGKQFKFVSNNSIRSDEEYLKKFKAIGVENVEADDVVQPAKVILRYLKQHKPGEKVFSLCSREANEMLTAHGIDVESLQNVPHWTPATAAKEIAVGHKVGAVLFDINLDLSYVGLVKAAQYLKNEECILIAGGSDRHLPLSHNIECAGFVDFLNHLSNYSHREPIMLGKPSAMLGNFLKEMFSITQPKRCLFIGDSMTNDIAFGHASGFQTLYVLTGTGTEAEMLQASVDGLPTPDYYADGLADFIKLFANVQNGN